MWGGGRAAAERRRARAERSDALDDAMAGYAQKGLDLLGVALEQMGGEQYRCACGLYGPKVLKATVRELADLVVKFAEAAKDKEVASTVIPFTVQVMAGGPIVPYGLEVPADIAGDSEMTAYLPAVWQLVRRAKALGWVDAVVEVLETDA